MKRALLVIDVQTGLFEKSAKIYREKEFLAALNALIGKFRNRGEPVVFIRHTGAGLVAGTRGWELHTALDRKPDDPVVDKTVPDAFSRPELKALLDGYGAGEVVICGLVSHGCVRATGLGGMRAGYVVTAAGDAHSSWNRDAASIIEEVNGEFRANGVSVVNAEDV